MRTRYKYLVRIKIYYKTNVKVWLFEESVYL